mmetsp:Transcript_8943/g.29402  ORF Transcript_8943/g.29402 Transcript_8943/m.29402 type:complete len:263 (+) Transcript_8943:671-1459(+)
MSMQQGMFGKFSSKRGQYRWERRLMNVHALSTGARRLDSSSRRSTIRTKQRSSTQCPCRKGAISGRRLWRGSRHTMASRRSSGVCDSRHPWGTRRPQGRACGPQTTPREQAVLWASSRAACACPAASRAAPAPPSPTSGGKGRPSRGRRWRCSRKGRRAVSPSLRRWRTLRTPCAGTLSRRRPMTMRARRGRRRMPRARLRKRLAKQPSSRRCRRVWRRSSEHRRSSNSDGRRLRRMRIFHPPFAWEMRHPKGHHDVSCHAN